MPVNCSPLRGRYLGRSFGSKHEAAFAGADLYAGRKQLVEPSLAQSALVTGSDASSVWWALRREDYREAIIAGELPLVPARTKAPPLVPGTNGSSALPASITGMIADSDVISFVRSVGVNRVLKAACLLESAAQ
jgi:hypothetical protein